MFPATVSGLWWRERSTSSDLVQKKKVRLEASVSLQLDSLSNRDTVIRLILYFFHLHHSRKKSPELPVQREGTITIIIQLCDRWLNSTLDLWLSWWLAVSPLSLLSLFALVFSVVLSLQLLNQLLEKKKNLSGHVRTGDHTVRPSARQTHTLY